MTFEDEFPNLAGKEMLKLRVINGHQLFFDERQIEEYCIEKQKVREAIEKIFTEHHMGTIWCNKWKEEILRELNL